jgi:DNA end-binding protein Ku
MPRSIWSGSIAFGLVNIPVKMYSAVQPKDVRFHQLHDADGVRIQQKRVCPADEEEVPFEHIVKGYEIAKGRYVVVRPEELRAIDPRANDTIEIVQFSDLSQVDPLHFEHSYYLGPDRHAAKAYALLVEAMERTHKAAIGRMVMRTRQYLTLVRPLRGILALETLLYADEVVSPSEIAAPKEVKIEERELSMATDLVRALSADFDPGQWRDEYRERVLELIEKKAQGAAIAEQPEVERAAPVVDLVAALRASLDRTAAGHGAEAQRSAASTRRAGAKAEAPSSERREKPRGRRKSA